MVFGLTVENYCSLHICAAARGPKIKDECMLVLAATTIRRDKLNSQFIITKFSILHAGGRSLFRFQTSRETRMAMLELEIAPSPAH